MDYTLSVGGHESPSDGRCAMEWIAYLCNEPHSASPSTVCPAMRHVMMMLNDNLSDEPRQKLRPFLARCVGTLGDGYQRRRNEVTAEFRPMVSQRLSAGRNLDDVLFLFIEPGGYLNRMLPLDRVSAPAPEKPARLVSDLDHLFTGIPVYAPPVTWGSLIKPQSGDLIEPVTEPGAFAKALGAEIKALQPVA